MYIYISQAQATEHPGDLWEALASGANCASLLLFLLFFVTRPAEA